MVKELILHLGDCKTGSTAVQMALADKAVQITGHSLYYPPGTNQNALAQTVNANKPGMTRAEQRDRADRAFAKMAARMAASDADFGIISAEHFEFADPDMLAQMLDTHFADLTATMRMIVYIRPHADRLLSSFAEISKLGGWQGDMDGFLARTRGRETLDYMPRLSRWQTLFGDRLIVRPFVRDDLRRGDIVCDVLHIVGRGAPVVVPEMTVQNTALSLQDLVMLRVIFDRIGAAGGAQADARRIFGRQIGRLLAPVPAPTQTKLALHRALAQEVSTLYAADAAALDAAFFDGTPMQTALQSAPAKAVDTPQDLRPETHFTPDTLRMMTAWGDMLARVVAADPAHAAWAFKPSDLRHATPPGYVSAPPPADTRPAWRKAASRLRAKLTKRA